jgi:hypothetical protein
MLSFVAFNKLYPEPKIKCSTPCALHPSTFLCNLRTLTAAFEDVAALLRFLEVNFVERVGGSSVAPFGLPVGSPAVAQAPAETRSRFSCNLERLEGGRTESPLTDGAEHVHPKQQQEKRRRSPFLAQIVLFPIKSCAPMVIEPRPAAPLTGDGSIDGSGADGSSSCSSGFGEPSAFAALRRSVSAGRWPLGPHGLLLDREWTLVGRDGAALRLSALPALALLRPTVDLAAGTLTVRAPVRAWKRRRAPRATWRAHAA